MGKINKNEIVAILKRDNPHARSDELFMYADSYLDYTEASENVEKNGAIVLHPRTGAPIENPYLKVKNSAMSQLRKFTKIKKVSALWK